MSVLQPVDGHGIPRSVYQQFSAVRTIGIAMHRYIAEVDIVQAGFLSDLFGAHQCLKTCGLMVQHLVIRMESAQVPWDMFSQFIGDERCHLLQVLVAVVLSGDDQCGHFDPDALAYHSSKGLFHAFKTAFKDLFIVGIVPAFEVDIGCIQPARHICNDLFRFEPVADKNVLQPSLFGDHTDIFGIGIKDGGFVVSIGDRSGAVLKGKVYHFFRRNFYLLVDMCLLRDIPVLAERAFEVTAYRPERKRFAARQQMIERFLLDRVDIECHRVSVHQVLQFSVLILVDPADPDLPLFELAVVLAEQTDDTVFPFFCFIIFHVFVCCHSDSFF